MTGSLQNVSIPPAVAVLLGGGVESTLLVGEFLREGRQVFPVHIHCGLLWDDAEAAWVDRFLSARSCERLHPLLSTRLPLAGFLGDHWAVHGRDVPPAGAPGARLEIPLRNLTLLGMAVHALKSHRGVEGGGSGQWGVGSREVRALRSEEGFDGGGSGQSEVGSREVRAWKSDEGLGGSEAAPSIPYEIALGTTADNHYADGSRDYFDRCEAVLSLEAGFPVRVLTPLIGLHKRDVLARSDAETLALSFSCVNPWRDPLTGGFEHCGRCIKCGSRRAAFREAGLVDPTRYAAEL